MPNQILRPIWPPADYWEALERAVTMHAAQCPAALTWYGESFPCDERRPHVTHTNAALGARWADEVVS